MQIKYKNTASCRKLLHSSMIPVEVIIRFASLANPNYDIYKQTGIKEGMPIQKQDAAERIVADMVMDGYYVDFVEALVRIDREGYRGTRYNLMGLSDVVDALENEGYSFDRVSGLFFENQQEQISLNWGRLKEGDEREMTVLRLDIAGNSELVKTNPRLKIEKAYNDIRNIMNRSVTSRIGRLWTWEGDGALAAFLFGSSYKMAVFAGMEIIHELFFYNRLRNPLDRPINIRLGAHIGQVIYSNNEMERLKNDTVKQAMILETMAINNSLSVSYNLYITMEQHILNLFSNEKNSHGRKYRLYKMGTEK